MTHPTPIDLSCESMYLNYIRNTCPEIEDYVQAFLSIGFTYKIAHKCLQGLYMPENIFSNKRFMNPSHTILIKINEMFFDETVKVNDDFVAKYHGDGTYYLHDTGSITKLLSNHTFKEFLITFGFAENKVDNICERYPNIEPIEYIICLLHYANTTLLSLSLPDFDKDNIIRWGRANLRKHAGIDYYLLNYNALKEFILTESNDNYIKSILALLREEFPNSKTVKTALALVSTGIIGDNTAHAKVYDVLKETNIEKCRKFITNSIVVAKKPKNLKINGSSVEFVTDDK